MKNLKVRNKIRLLALILICGQIFLGVVGIVKETNACSHSLEIMKQVVSDDYDKNIKGQVENVLSLMNVIYQQQLEGNLTEEEAKTQIKEQVKALKYNESGYFWIDDTDATLIAHPLLSEREGEDRTNEQDKKGNMIIQNIIKVAKNGGGYTEFYYIKPNEDGVSPKRAYSLLFEPYNWIVSTGNYIDDLDDLVAQKKVELEQEIFNSIRMYCINIGCSILIAMALTFFISKSIIGALNKTNECVDHVAQGDFTYKFEGDMLTRKDDFGILAGNLERMKISIGSLIHKSKREAESIIEVVGKVTSNVSALNSNIEDVSATTEELAAGMEETAASAEEMNATSQLIQEASKSIADKSREGAEQALLICNRAETTKKDVNNSRDKANELNKNIKIKLQNALEQVKVVENIKVLSDAIMGIARQTNLLALNASIEAARAGESGRGFTVVAEEIGGLAEQSTATVAKIQDVTAEVTSAVKTLSESANALLNYVTNEVDEDYEKFLQVADEYYNDSVFIDELVVEFNRTAESLLTSIGDVMVAVEEVSNAANEGASGTTSIAEKITEITYKSQELLAEVNNTKQSTDNLKEEISKFTI